MLARQIAMLGLTLAAVALALAFPLRNYLAQKADQQVALAQQQQLEQQVDALTQRKAALSDPDYIAAQARKRLQYVRPGDTVYVVRPPELPASHTAAAPQQEKQQPWYGPLWETLVAPPEAGATTQSGARTTTPAAPTR